MPIFIGFACRCSRCAPCFSATSGESNSLVSTPRFYNTITANCTTLVYHMMTRIVGYLPLSYRILITGYFPAYVYAVGGLDQRFPLEELRALGTHHRSGEARRIAAAHFPPIFATAFPPSIHPACRTPRPSAAA